MSTGQQLNSSTYSMMQTSEPIKRYIKTILGKLQVHVLNPFTGNPEGLIIAGNPARDKQECIIEIWSEQEDLYFKRANKRHFEQGYLSVYKPKKDKVVKKSPNDITDEELEEMLGLRFLAFQSKLSKFTSVAPVYRALVLAEELGKTDKIKEHIKAKLAELQAEEYAPYEVKSEEE